MRVPGLWRLERAWRRARLMRHVRGLILLYHRVDIVERDPLQLAVTPATFEAHLTALGELGCPVLPLEDMQQAAANGTLPERAVSITFDDGYLDNLTEAAPVLRRHNMPATFFITSSFVEAGCGAWWDRLDRAIFDGEVPMDGIPFEAGGERKSLPARTHADRCAALLRLVAELRQQLPDKRADLVDGLVASCRGEQLSADAHRFMTPAQLRELDAMPGLELGAHTVTHPALGFLPMAIQKQEIDESKTWLEGILRREVRTFSFPFGQKVDYGPETREIVRQAGFTSCCANWPEPIWRCSDPLALTRFVVRDWDQATFKAQIQRWFAGETD